MICHSLLGNRVTRIPCVVGANSASITEKKFKKSRNGRWGMPVKM